MRFVPDLHPYLPLLSRAFAVSSAMRVAVYDCLCVVLAQQEGCELLTADEKLVRNLQASLPLHRFSGGPPVKLWRHLALVSSDRISYLLN